MLWCTNCSSKFIDVVSKDVLSIRRVPFENNILELSQRYKECKLHIMVVISENLMETPFHIDDLNFLKYPNDYLPLLVNREHSIDIFHLIEETEKNSKREFVKIKRNPYHSSHSFNLETKKPPKFNFSRSKSLDAKWAMNVFPKNKVDESEKVNDQTTNITEMKNMVDDKTINLNGNSFHEKSSSNTSTLSSLSFISNSLPTCDNGEGTNTGKNLITTFQCTPKELEVYFTSRLKQLCLSCRSQPSTKPSSILQGLAFWKKGTKTDKQVTHHSLKNCHKMKISISNMLMGIIKRKNSKSDMKKRNRSDSDNVKEEYDHLVDGVQGKKYVGMENLRSRVLNDKNAEENSDIRSRRWRDFGDINFIEAYIFVTSSEYMGMKFCKVNELEELLEGGKNRRCNPYYSCDKAKDTGLFNVLELDSFSNNYNCEIEKILHIKYSLRGRIFEKMFKEDDRLQVPWCDHLCASSVSQ